MNRARIEGLHAGSASSSVKLLGGLHGNKTKAAAILGIRRPRIHEKIELNDLKPPEGSGDQSG